MVAQTSELSRLRVSALVVSLAHPVTLAGLSTLQLEGRLLSDASLDPLTHSLSSLSPYFSGSLLPDVLFHSLVSAWPVGPLPVCQLRESERVPCCCLVQR